MKGDFSRIRFTPAEHFTSVLQQQGRVSVDADGNEQSAIDEYLRTTEIVDTIGTYGGPANDAGFKISISGSTILIGSGRYYVHGLLCEPSRKLHYTDQPYLIEPELTDTDLLEQLRIGQIAALCLKLQVWQRFVTALDDSCLLEPALGQADTTARLQTVWRVIAAPIQNPTTSSTNSTTTVDNNLNAVRFSDQLVAKKQTTGPQLEKVETSLDANLILNSDIHFIADPTTDVFSQSSAEAGQVVVVRDVPGRLCVTLNDAGADCSCQPIPPAGYQGLENQLYRIEIHQGGDETTATFKWSRENASVVAVITNFSGNNAQTVYVDSLGKDANLGFSPNQWVEISDATNEFGDDPNQPGQLCQISSISSAGQPPSITFTSPVPSVDPTKQARARRWDQPGTGTAGDMPLSITTPIDIENGIQVTFTAGSYHTGDYWLVPARTASGSIDWPPCGTIGQCQPASSIPIYTAPLALITFDQDTDVAKTRESNRALFSVQDLRSVFAPLSSGAMHVTHINWHNDNVMTLDQLLASGLELSLDNFPTQQIDGATFRVSLEVPDLNDAGRFNSLLKDGNNQGQVPTVGSISLLRQEYVLDGIVTVKNQLLSWQLLVQDANKIDTVIDRLTVQELNNLLQTAVFTPTPTLFTRVRVRILGHMIFAQPLVAGGCVSSTTQFLDGQCFAKLGQRSDKSANIALSLPSGKGSIASDFESWFYLAPITVISSVTFDPATISPAGVATGSTTGTVTLQSVAANDVTIALQPTPPTGLNVTVPATIIIAAGTLSNTFTASFTVAQIAPNRAAVCTVGATPTLVSGDGDQVTGTFTVVEGNVP